MSAAIALETTIYSAITPLLPYYADRLGLGRTAIGVLTATYPTGIVIGAIIGSVLVRRVGVRSATVGALVGLACSTAVLGVGAGVASLYLGRLGQGVSAGCMWSSALAWLFLWAGGRRGTALARAMSAGVVGVVAGPLLGTLASLTGPAPIYLAAAVAILTLSVVMATLESPVSGRTDRRLGRGQFNGGVMTGVALVLFAGFVLGTVNALIPLRLSALGATQAVIGATFLVAAVVAGVVSQPIGSAVDRVAPVRLVVVGLASLSVSCAAVGPASALGALAGLTIVIMGFALVLEWVPAMSLLADRVEATGASVAVAAAFVNVSVATGEAVGSTGSASLASLSGGDVLPFAVLAVLALTLAVLARGSAAVDGSSGASRTGVDRSELASLPGARIAVEAVSCAVHDGAPEGDRPAPPPV